MLVDFGRAGLIEKARLQPDKVKMALNKIRTDGLKPTIDAVRNKLDQPLAMGYSNAGVVEECGAGVTGFQIGDRVASNGKHAEMVSVPVNLCARIPENVSDNEAAFAVISAIGLQGIRLVEPTLGESVVVTGLGLIGLITVQLLQAHGCRVLGIDMDPSKLELARRFGAETVNLSVEDPVAIAESFSRGRGVDAVIVTAATRSSEPIHQAALMCRKRGRIVLVGVTGLELSRADFFQKELAFQVSCSYGPGRYDATYEERGQDYPIGFVRWTEQRNFEAVLDMMSTGALDVKPLISHRFPVNRAADAYDIIAGGAPSLGIVLEYPAPAKEPDAVRSTLVQLAPREAVWGEVREVGVGFIGSGNYAAGVLIPAFKAGGARLLSVASNGGVTGVHAAKKFGFGETTTDPVSVFSNPAIHAVVITTRHDSHARFVVQGLEAGKHVFVEKPLCLSLEELQSIERAYKAAGATRHPLLMIGFNRRFAPHSRKIKALLEGATGPKSFVMTVNAGAIPADHWVQDPAIGGGRINGEACHFIDLLRFLAASPIVSFDRGTMAGPTDDTASIRLSFADGSVGTIHYFANGAKNFPKERLEVFSHGRVLQLDNFRKLKGFGWPGFSSMKLWQQDKGQKACAVAFLDAIRSGALAPIPFDEIVEVTRVTLELAR
jgi:predicted dehydrogenase/threonine dehydrogenase-like Zn-dependent dehydrogenase